MTLVLMSALVVAAQIASPPARGMASAPTNEKRSRPSGDEPVAKELSSPALGEVRTFFEYWVAEWDDPKKEAKPCWDAERTTERV